MRSFHDRWLCHRYSSACIFVKLSTAQTAAELFAHRYNLAPGSERALSPHFYVLTYITNFTSTEIDTHQTLVNLLHVSESHRRHHQQVLSLFNVAPSKWSVAKYSKWVTHSHNLSRALKFTVKHQNVHGKKY
jgi:hypothetical protein